jgi:hypothetical protein
VIFKITYNKWKWYKTTVQNHYTSILIIVTFKFWTYTERLTVQVHKTCSRSYMSCYLVMRPVMPYATGTRTVCLFIQLHTTALRLIVQSWLDVPTFATRRLHVSPRESTRRRRNCGQEMSNNFAEMTTSTPFRDLLHAVKLWHGTDSFTSPSKEDVLRTFSP